MLLKSCRSFYLISNKTKKFVVSTHNVDFPGKPSVGQVWRGKVYLFYFGFLDHHPPKRLQGVGQSSLSIFVTESEGRG